MTDTPKEMHNNDRKLLAEHFVGKTFNDKIVYDFCTRNKIAVTDAGSVEDFIYQNEYDTRLKTITPLILTELAKFQVSGEYDTPERQKEVLESNDSIAEKIARVLEDNGVLYREIEVLPTIGADLSQILTNAEGLSSRMCANVLAEMGQEKLGNPLTIKALADERAQIADRKFKAQEAEKGSEEEAK
jgi:hypothetical protein